MLLGSKSRYSKATPGRFPDKKPIKFSYILTMFNQHRDFPEIKSHITPETMLSSLPPSPVSEAPHKISEKTIAAIILLFSTPPFLVSLLSLSLSLSFCLYVSLTTDSSVYLKLFTASRLFISLPTCCKLC